MPRLDLKGSQDSGTHPSPGATGSPSQQQRAWHTHCSAQAPGTTRGQCGVCVPKNPMQPTCPPSHHRATHTPRPTRHIFHLVRLQRCLKQEKERESVWPRQGSFSQSPKDQTRGCVLQSPCRGPLQHHGCCLCPRPAAPPPPQQDCWCCARGRFSLLSVSQGRQEPSQPPALLGQARGQAGGPQAGMRVPLAHSTRLLRKAPAAAGSSGSTPGKTGCCGGLSWAWRYPRPPRRRAHLHGSGGGDEGEHDVVARAAQGGQQRPSSAGVGERRRGGR